MKRRRDATAGRRDSAEVAQIDDDDAVAANAPASAQGENLSPAPAHSATVPAGRAAMRERNAEIARGRAAFFARGGGAGTGLTEEDIEERSMRDASNRPKPPPAADTVRGNAGVRGHSVAAASYSSDDDDDEENARAPTGWSGPFTVGMELLRAREKAAKRREKDVAGNDNGKSGNKRRRKHDEAEDEDAETETAAQAIAGGLLTLTAQGSLRVRASDYACTWKPSRALPSYTSILDKLKGLGGDSASPAASPPAGTGGMDGQGGAEGPTLSPSSTAQPAPRRRAVAVAGPSGVRLGVPRLSYFALQTLVPFVPQMDDLSPLPQDLRKAFADALCRTRGMDSHAFSLFAYAAAGVALPSALRREDDDDEGLTGHHAGEGSASLGGTKLETLDILDCAGVEEGALVSSLRAASGRIGGTVLGHAGRGLNDHAVRALVLQDGAGKGAGLGMSALEPTCVFSTLHTLHIAGAYALSETGLANILTHTSLLTSLRLTSNELLDGTFIGRLHTTCPLLEELALEACPKIGDSQILGEGPIKGPGQGKRKRQAAVDSATASRGGRGGGPVPSTVQEEEEALQAGLYASMSHGMSNTAANNAQLTVKDLFGEEEEEAGKEIDHDLAAAISQSLQEVSTASASEASASEGAGPPLSMSTASATGGICALPRLACLSLAHLPTLTDAPLVAWLGSKRTGSSSSAGSRNTAPVPLRSLCIKRCASVTDATCAALAAHMLDAGHCTDPQGADHAVPSSLSSSSRVGASHRGLERLRLEYLPKVTGLGVDAISAALVGVKAGACAVSGSCSLAGAAFLPPPLSDLSLHGCASLPSRTVLALIVAGGASCPRLQRLCLSGVSGTDDACLVAAARLHAQTLTAVNVSFCRGLTDAGLGALADGCPRLASLCLWGCTQVSGVFYLGHARAEGGQGGGDDGLQPQGGQEWAQLRVYGRDGDVMPAPEA